jgi:hypothetical protein
MPRYRRQSFIVNNFKIDQPRLITLVIIDHISHACVAVRPESPELFAPELVRPAEFESGRLHHTPAEGATI